MKKKITFVFFIIFFILLSSLVLLLTKINEIEDTTNIIQNQTVTSQVQNVNKIQVILEKHNTLYKQQTKRYNIYVVFPKDLYDINGNSNQDFFEKMIFELSETKELTERDFSLIDEEKEIEINVIYDAEKDEHIIKYNKKEDFYRIVDGDMYSQVEKSEIVKQGHIVIIANELNELINANMFFKDIKNIVGEGTPINDKYTSFQNGAIFMRLLNGKVRNIVFTEKFEGEVLSGITVGTELSKILEKYPNISGGSINAGYLYYRVDDDVYVFCYDDEISVYGYSYFENEAFEEFLEEYLNDKDLDKFIQKVTKKWTNQEIYEYNPEIQSAHITYPSRGVEINIKDNNSLGITLYNNYYLTDKTKKFIKEGKISINANDDLLVLSEEKRREDY